MQHIGRIPCKAHRFSAMIRKALSKLSFEIVNLGRFNRLNWSCLIMETFGIRAERERLNSQFLAIPLFGLFPPSYFNFLYTRFVAVMTNYQLSYIITT